MNVRHARAPFNLNLDESHSLKFSTNLGNLRIVTIDSAELRGHSILPILLGGGPRGLLLEARAQVHLPHPQAQLRAQPLAAKGAYRDNRGYPWAIEHGHDAAVRQDQSSRYARRTITLQNSTGLYDSAESRNVGGPEGIRTLDLSVSPRNPG